MTQHPRIPAYSQCTGKESYGTPQMAVKVARRRNFSKKRRGQLARPLAAYRCEHCGFFHIGGLSKP